jgi:hypothetical protein
MVTSDMLDAGGAQNLVESSIRPIALRGLEPSEAVSAVARAGQGVGGKASRKSITENLLRKRIAYPLRFERIKRINQMQTCLRSDV